MGLGDCCLNLRDGIRDSPPAQLALSFAGGVILMTLLFAVSGMLRVPSCPPATPPAYLSFALNSQQTVCKAALDSASNITICAHDLLKNLSVHGLWPGLTGWRPKGGGLTACAGAEPFNLALLTDEDRKRMAARWSSALIKRNAVDVTDVTFWRHEWEKHGSCSAYHLKGFFERTLALDERYPLNRWLAEAAITPNNSRAYSLGEATTALGRHLPTSSFYLQCQSLNSSSGKSGGKVVQALYQVVLCLGWPDGSSHVQCPHRPANESCSAPFYFVEDYQKL